MLKKILLTLFKPNHQPEMNLSNSSADNPFTQQTGEALAIDLINKFWVKNKAANNNHAKAMVKSVAEKMMSDCRTIFSSPDPILVNRQLLAESVLTCAKLQVLVISPLPEHDASGLRGHLGITGELRSRILDIIKIDQEFDNFPKDLSSEKALNQIQFAYRRAWAYMNLFERLRHEYNDIHSEQSEDWFRPFFASQCAYSENKYRVELGMQNLLSSLNNLDETLGIMYGNYRDIVLNGDKFPDLTWEKKYPKLENPKTIWKN
jgi:hypothetical protein